MAIHEITRNGTKHKTSIAMLHQSALQNFVPDILECQLTQTTATEYLIVGDIGKRERRFRKAVQFFVRFKTDLRQYQSEQIAKKHIDGKVSPGELKRITVLTNLVGFKQRQRVGFNRVEIGVRD